MADTSNLATWSGGQRETGEPLDAAIVLAIGLSFDRSRHGLERSRKNMEAGWIAENSSRAMQI